MKSGLRTFQIIIIAVIAVLFAGTARSGVVEQTNMTDWISIDQYAPLGQSFTAVDTSTIDTISLFFDVADSFASEDDLKISVYNEAGLGGTMLGFMDFSLPVSNPFDWYDVDFSALNITLTQGSIYSLGISTATTRWAIGKNLVFDGNGNPVQYPDYAGGQAIISGSLDASNDLAFKVSTTVVPEPVSTVLFIVGGSVLAGRRFLKKRK